jgi:secreted trypsin-like serine protease
MNEPRGFGGACYGDSGGPNYVEIDGVDVLVGITVTGDVPCFATNVVYRTDTESARDFLAQYVDLPE